MSIAKPQLITTWRFRVTSEVGRTLAIEASSDRSRIVFCEAFRQLHRKAQVFSLEAAGSARTRLTHSLEVAQIGRYLTQVVFEIADPAVLRAHNIDDKGDIAQSFVESACLVHDIGNPPFGHFGELAIRHWFEKNMDELQGSWCDGSTTKKHRFAPLMRDFTNFDGNPQGFRILTRLMWGTDERSLNLTATQLASSVKYNVSPSGIEAKNPIRKKAGFFQTESEIAKEVFAQLGIAEGCRHPFAYLMEAADDIAYCLSDIEDAILKGMVTETGFLDEVAEKVESNKEFSEFASFIPKKVAGKYPMGAYLLFRVRCINKIVRLAAQEFVDNHEAYFLGGRGPILDNVAAARVLLEYIKSVAQNRIYNSTVVLRNELIGAQVISFSDRIDPKFLIYPSAT